ncbi:hypothetical protein HPB48_010599 [Haemaphysalis longicornis]|uniref:Uncharacterized protein n=1 Tax=Haemaphysalis longicornis TaxID=44386 RepID=A0A9J6FT55_HAELO|nr:hypothetical protein HPB48_010599 [Haemaphysalis longicornis]
MPEVEMVEGEEISSVCRSKKVRAEAAPGSVLHEGVKGGRRTAAPQGVAKHLAAASRLPRLPMDHIRIIARPRDDLDIKKSVKIRLAQALAMAVALSRRRPRVTSFALTLLRTFSSFQRRRRGTRRPRQASSRFG